MKAIYVTITVKVQKSLDEHESPPYEGEVAELKIPLVMLRDDVLANTFRELLNSAGEKCFGSMNWIPVPLED